MEAVICSCQGLNPNCEKCFGSGYVPTKTSKKPATKQTDKKKKKKKKDCFHFPSMYGRACSHFNIYFVIFILCYLCGTHKPTF